MCIAPKITEDKIIAHIFLNVSFSVFILFITKRKGIIKIISSAINCIIVETKKSLKLSGFKLSKIGFVFPSIPNCCITMLDITIATAQNKRPKII